MPMFRGSAPSLPPTSSASPAPTFRPTGGMSASFCPGPDDEIGQARRDRGAGGHRRPRRHLGGPPAQRRRRDHRRDGDDRGHPGGGERQADGPRRRADRPRGPARGARAAARERLSLLEAGPRPHEIEAARAELRAARERVELLRAGARPQEVEMARARLAEARAALALAQARLDETRLTSPITGVVLRKNVEPGETVNPGISILTLMDPQDLWVRAYVPETEIGRLRIGQAATVSVDAFPGRGFPGAITEIASEAEFTPKNVQTRKERVNLVFRVKVAVRNPEGLLKPGMPADVDIRP